MECTALALSVLEIGKDRETLLMGGNSKLLLSRKLKCSIFLRLSPL